ncbi:cellulase family glycosylhydrolase [Pendulispora brunnea]|uniref:Cellulase family glycosylhydrolase n=1 Tax=Pendulispora brunnea TaxID=2905690 RepID=A0ABZ2K6H9_9BACT
MSPLSLRRRRFALALPALLALMVTSCSSDATDDTESSVSLLAQTIYEAENANIGQGVVESNHAGYSGSGFVNFDNVTGSYVEFTVNAAVAGNTALTFRFANGTTTNRPLDIAVNGTVVSSDVAFAGTGAWTNWQDVTITANLRAGANTVRATATTANGGPNLDKLTESTGGGGGGGTPVEQNGQLHVCGTKLCNKNGKAIQLRGMSTHGLQWHRDCVSNASLDALANDWKADILRISMYIESGGYQSNPRFYTDLVHQIIEQATARGLYALVDWHMLEHGDPNYHLSRAKTFFTEIAQRHANKPNILYEVANEPSDVSWATIKSYHEQIIPVIRQQDPDAVILLGTRAWSSLGVSEDSDETEVVNNPVNASNIMYTFHFYAASHRGEYLDALSRAADRIPMFVTEFGTQDYTGGGANDFTQSQAYINLMATKKISWTNWNYSDDPLSGAAFTEGTCPNGPYAGTSRLKPAGAWIRERTRLPDDF